MPRYPMDTPVYALLLDQQGVSHFREGTIYLSGEERSYVTLDGHNHWTDNAHIFRRFAPEDAVSILIAPGLRLDGSILSVHWKNNEPVYRVHLMYTPINLDIPASEARLEPR